MNTNALGGAMLRYAVVDGRRTLPVPRGRGSCPVCGGGVIAKCGTLVAHHWAHESIADCDAWSEPIGPWHLAWQEMVRPEFVEVPMGPHRADLVGTGGVVIELQHSPISPDVVAERERFYGRMIWLFDATDRFHVVHSGDRCFFSLGRTKHLAACSQPVVLDFGALLVEVEATTDVLRGLSGYGRPRSHAEFVAEHLAGRTRDEPPSFLPCEPCRAETWPGRPPWSMTVFPTRWIDGDRELVIPKGTLFFPADGIHHDPATGSRRPAWTHVVADHPRLANGWTESDLWEMKSLLNARPLILEGRLRLMPSRADEIPVTTTVEPMREGLDRVDAHIRAGRLPILRDETRSLLLRKAHDVESRISRR